MTALKFTLLECCPAGCILDKLTDIQDHPVWGKALAGVQKSGWCSDHKILAAVHLGRVSVESRLGEKQMQQLQSALLRPMPQRSLEVSILSMPCYATIGAALLSAVHARLARPAEQVDCC